MEALIDLDIVLYRAGFAAEKTWYKIYEKGAEDWGWVRKFRYNKDAKAWVNGEWDTYSMEKEQEVEPLQNGIHNVKSMMERIIHESGADTYRGFLTGKDNYRELVATMYVYKGNRDPSHKPFYYKELKQYLIDEWGAEVVDGYEADDELSMVQYANPNTIICTLDKDLDGVPGLHYNWVRRAKYFVTLIEGMRFFYSQMLTGDATDNIPGLFKLTGSKCTKKLLAGLEELDTEKDLWLYIKGIYDDAWDLKERQGINLFSKGESRINKLTEVARLLWMSKDSPDDWSMPE